MAEHDEQCTICHAIVDEEDLFCANCGAEVPQTKSGSDDIVHLDARETTHNFRCSGCGASMSYDASAQNLRCPFCGSEKLDRQADAKTISPTRVVPFAVDKAQADAITRQWLGTGWLRPGDLSEAAIITKMAAVYVPYWVFSAHTHTYWTADTSQKPPSARGDWFPRSGEHHGHHAGVLVGASGALTPAETHTLCPFDLGAAQAPDAVDLDNVIVEEFNVARKYARPLARSGLEELERQTVTARYVPGRSRNVKINTMFTGLTSEPTLLPVWIMAYTYRDTPYRFLINGQTGEPYGQKPTSYHKILAIVAAVIFAIVALLFCMGVFGAIANAVSQRTTHWQNYTCQFSNAKPATRINSFVFAVTSVKPVDNACAAINVSYGPIGVPTRSSWLRTCAADWAATESNARTWELASNVSTFGRSRAGSAHFSTPV